MKLIFDRIERAPMPFFIRPVAKKIARGVNCTFIGPQIKTHLDYIEAELGNAPWLAGADFGAADIQMSFPLEAAAARGGLTEQAYPRMCAFLARIHARPAYQRALERGGKYDLLH